MSGGPDFLKKLARGMAAAKAVVGSDLIAESLPVAIGRDMARPVIERRRKRGDGSEKFVLILPLGEGQVRIELTPDEFEALTREMVRFWNAQGEAPPPARLEHKD